MRKAIKVLKIIGNVVLWLFVAFAIFVTVLVFSAQGNKDGLPDIMGKSLVTIQSDSMSPVFKKGDLIIDKILTAEEKKNCKVGDIITMYYDIDGDGEEEINTHRIVEVYEENGTTYYITQGDNEQMSPVADRPTSAAKVLGKYTGTKIPFVGSFISFLQTSTGFLVVIVIPLILFFLYELYHFFAVVVRIRMKDKVSAEQEEEIKKRAIEEYLRQQAQNQAQTDEPSEKSEEKSEEKTE